MTFGRGWIPEGPEHADIGLEYAKPRARVTPWGAREPSSSLRVFYGDAIRDQNGASECVGFAIARAIRVRSCVEISTGARSEPIPYPSSHAIYAEGRDPGGQSIQLADDGCVPRLAIYALATFGVVADERWPFDMATIYQHVPPDVLRAGADAMVDGFVPLPSGDVDAIKDAIYAGHPVVGGVVVDHTFEDYAGGIMPDNDGANLGGHFLCFVEYGPDFIGGDNSWGTGWGEDGRFRMSLERAARIRDLYALILAPPVAE